MQYIRQTYITTHQLTIPVRFETTDPADSGDVLNKKTYLSEANVLLSYPTVVVGISVGSLSTDLRGMVGFTSISLARIAQFVLVVKNKRGETVIDKFPLYDLARANTRGKIRRFYIEMDPMKSYLQRITTPGVDKVASNEAIPLTIHYRLLNSKKI